MSIATTDYSLETQFPIEEKYLINTSKIVKGHKITLKDTLRRQLIKSRASSQSRGQQEFNSQMPNLNVITEYTEKYHALETIDDEFQMMKFIVYKRFQESRASQRGIKMFSRQTVRPKTTTHVSPKSSNFATTRNAKTSHSRRSNLEKESKHTTLSYEVHNSIKDNQNKGKVQFASENIDPRMAQCLNMILKKKEKDQIYISELQLKQMMKATEQKLDITPKMLEIRNGRNRSINNSFLRQMKKHQNSKMKNNENSQYRTGSDELVKSLKRNKQINSQIGKMDKSILSTNERSFSKYCSIENFQDSQYNTKRNKESKFQKSYMSTVTPKTYEYQSRGNKSSINSARKSYF